MCPILSLIPPRSLAENTSDPKSHCDLTTRAARGIFTVRSGYFLSGYPLLCKPCSDVHVLDDLIAHHLWHGQVRIPLALQALFGPVLGSWQRGGLTGSSGYPLLCKPCSDMRLWVGLRSMLMSVRIPLALQALFGPDETATNYAGCKA